MRSVSPGAAEGCVCLGTCSCPQGDSREGRCLSNNKQGSEHTLCSQRCQHCSQDNGKRYHPQSRAYKFGLFQAIKPPYLAVPERRPTGTHRCFPAAAHCYCKEQHEPRRPAHSPGCCSHRGPGCPPPVTANTARGLRGRAAPPRGGTATWGGFRPPSEQETPSFHLYSYRIDNDTSGVRLQPRQFC